jgi:formylmethanofuran dehydrogenase subunit E
MRYIGKHNPEFELKSGKRLCSRCGEREVYQDTKTMDWCEPCIAKFVEDGNDLRSTC